MTATPNLPSQYEPRTAEAKWQQLWEQHQVFKADPNHPGEPYCIVIPPPNVTGSLHMGHAFEHSLIDVLIRYHRMIGRNTLWLPGTDHASIAVQTILERQLKAEGKTREDLGREKFLERAWQWKEESGGTIVGQLRRLGLSVDWSRERFTMDEGLSRAVLEAFNKLYAEGLIYRGNYLVNWCPATQSAVSDLEVENQEVNGHLWHFRYPLSDGSGFVEVATTRPETMLGDTAVAVNPEDDRYKSLVGKTLTLPLMNREIPIVADEYVDSSFGTGCVKVTPAHDPNDFEIGKRHNLPFINLMNKDGSMNENAGEFAGQDRFVARKNVVAALDRAGFLVKVEDYKHTVPYSDRGKVPGRAAALDPVVCQNQAALGADAGMPGSAELAGICARSLGQGLPRLVGESARLVHFASALVGTPDSRLVCGQRNGGRNHRHDSVCGGDERGGSAGESDRPVRPRRAACPRSRCAGHLVLVGTVAVLDFGLAGGY